MFLDFAYFIFSVVGKDLYVFNNMNKLWLS